MADKTSSDSETSSSSSGTSSSHGLAEILRAHQQMPQVPFSRSKGKEEAPLLKSSSGSSSSPSTDEFMRSVLSPQVKKPATPAPAPKKSSSSGASFALVLVAVTLGIAAGFGFSWLLNRPGQKKGEGPQWTSDPAVAMGLTD